MSDSELEPSQPPVGGQHRELGDCAGGDRAAVGEAEDPRRIRRGDAGELGRVGVRDGLEVVLGGAGHGQR